MPNTTAAKVKQKIFQPLLSVLNVIEGLFEHIPLQVRGVKKFTLQLSLSLPFAAQQGCDLVPPLPQASCVWTQRLGTIWRNARFSLKRTPGPLRPQPGVDRYVMDAHKSLSVLHPPLAYIHNPLHLSNSHSTWSSTHPWFINRMVWFNYDSSGNYPMHGIFWCDPIILVPFKRIYLCIGG